MANSISNNNIVVNQVSGSYNLATAFKSHFKKEMHAYNVSLERYVDERNQLKNNVEERQVTLNETRQLGPFNKKATAIIGCLIETQEMERKRIALLDAMISDISDGIRVKDRQANLMEEEENVSSVQGDVLQKGKGEEVIKMYKRGFDVNGKAIMVEIPIQEWYKHSY